MAKGILNAEHLIDGTLEKKKLEASFLTEFNKVQTDSASALTKAKANETYINGTLKDTLSSLQTQIDDAVESWFEHADPTLNNAPAKDWIAAGEQEKHLNDTYTNLDSGHCWRWTKEGSTYKWTPIADTATVKALALAGEAKNAAAAAQSTADVAKTTADKAVPNTRKINGKQLNADITLTATDIGAATSAEITSAVNAAITALKDTLVVGAVEQLKPVSGVVTLTGSNIKEILSVAYAGLLLDKAEYTVSGNKITIKPENVPLETGEFATVNYNKGL